MSFLRDPKRLIATLIAGVTGLIVLTDFAGGFVFTDVVARMLVGWSALVAALALLVGLLSVAASHFMRVWRQNADWGYSLVLLISMLLVIVSGTIVGIWNDNGEMKIVFPPTSLVERPIRDLFSAFYLPLAGSFLALLAFFSLSAALRALRRGTTEALVIIVVAILVLGFAALPQAQVMPLLGDGFYWVYDYIALAGARGLLIGAALGAVVAGVRVLLGFDQPYLDR
jgi:hypothetical protein